MESANLLAGSHRHRAVHSGLFPALDHRGLFAAHERSVLASVHAAVSRHADGNYRPACHFSGHHDISRCHAAASGHAADKLHSGDAHHARLSLRALSQDYALCAQLYLHLSRRAARAQAAHYGFDAVYGIQLCFRCRHVLGGTELV